MKRAAELALAVVLSACVENAPTTHSPNDGVEPSAPAPNEAPHETQADRLTAIARAYAGYTKVTIEPQIAPTLCAAPPVESSGLRFSKSQDEASHGKKIYYLFASDADAYLRDARRAGARQPAGQTLVKEAWIAEETSWEAQGDTVGDGSKIYRPGERASLFVMSRRGDGWEFGLVAPDGTVTTEGPATAGCHGCHDGQRDGLFGLRASTSAQGNRLIVRAARATAAEPIHE